MESLKITDPGSSPRPNPSVSKPVLLGLLCIVLFAVGVSGWLGYLKGNSITTKQVADLTSQVEQLNNQVGTLQADKSNLQNQVASLQQQLRKATARPARKKPVAKSTKKATYHGRK